MRHLKSRGWLGGIGKAAFAIAFAVVGAGASAAGITDTKHNLSTTAGNPGLNKTTAGTAEICVFCHTPHAANTGVEAPLWNKTLPGTSYTTYSTTNSTTIDGSVLSVGSVSLACLSCHDGTQAMDNIINAPGSGQYDSTGGGVAGRGYTWASGAGVTVDADGKLTSASVAMLGDNLRNDHPIGIQYCGGGPTVAAPATACVDKDFKTPQSGTVGSTTVLWVDTAGGTAGSRDKSDMILYNRTFTALGPSVECASCHDPHVKEGEGTVAAGATFLRISNAGSAVCLACHTK